MEYKYKVKWCPICEQGWVQIVKELKTDKLFLCCSECETEWNEPSNITAHTCCKFGSFGKYIAPHIEEIQKMKWDKYIL